MKSLSPRNNSSREGKAPDWPHCGGSSPLRWLLFRNRDLHCMCVRGVVSQGKRKRAGEWANVGEAGRWVGAWAEGMEALARGKAGSSVRECGCAGVRGT